MTTFARLRRLRRPVAVLLLVCMMSCFACPMPSRAVDPVTASIFVGGLAMAYARWHLPINQAVMRYGDKAAYYAGRFGPWAIDKGKGLYSKFGTFMQTSGDKIIGFANQSKIGIDKAWQWIKSHPGDAAEIGGLLVDLVDALTGSDMPHTAEAVSRALNPNQSGPISSGTRVGDIVEVEGCGRREVTDILESFNRCDSVLPTTNSDCELRQIYYFGPKGSRTCYEPDGYLWLRKVRLRQAPDIPDVDQPTIPDQLSDQQSQRLLDEIEKKLQSHREEMEKELDELLKKNLDDIDWPDFDNDAAQEYLAQKRGQDLQDKIDELQEELERKRQEREQQCQQQQGDCQNKCCDTSCDESRLANRLDQLRDRLDDLNQQQEDQAVQEYPPPAVPETELKKIDFQPVVDLKGELMTKFPFNMLRLIPSAFEVLTAEPVAPYWDANLGDIGGTHRVDFAVLDGLASFIRLVISWLCYIAAVFCCLKIWSRF